jgi:hypothetical protein
MPRGSLALGTSSAQRCLLFVPGFLVPPRAYTALLAPVADRVGRVIVLPPAASTVALMAGRHSPGEQARHVGEVARELQRTGVEVIVGGHSRGGPVALLASRSIAPVGLVLVDPVSGGGGPWAAAEPLPSVRRDRPGLVVGCGSHGRCAPAGRDHEVFAAALPGCHHTVVPDCGHADVLNGLATRLGGLLCGHGNDRRRAREGVSRAVVEFLS